MEFFFNSRFDSLIGGISGQFGTTPLGFLLFCLTILAFPLVLLIIYRRQQKKSTRELLEKSRRIIEKKAAKLELNAREKEVLLRLAEETGSGKSGYLILFDELRFNKALETLSLEDPDFDTDAAAALRVKLEFKMENSGKPRSTAALPKGSSLLLKGEKEKTILHAELNAILPEGFEIRIQPPYRLAIGDKAVFQYQNAHGVFLFKSECLKRDGQLHVMSHQSHFQQKQKRAFFRSPWDGPVELSLFEKGDSVSARFIEIGGGGASVSNPAGRFSQGDFISLTFQLPGNSHRFELRGQVLRTTKQNSRLHIKFEGLKDGDRDKIIGLIFKPKAEVK